MLGLICDMLEPAGLASTGSSFFFLPMGLGGSVTI